MGERQGPLPQSWRDAVSAKLEEMGISDSELARRVGCKNNEEIHYLLRAKKPRKRSKWARPVAEHLGIPIPGEPMLEDWESAWLDVGRAVHDFDAPWLTELERLIRDRLAAQSAIAKNDEEFAASLTRRPSDRRGKP